MLGVFIGVAALDRDGRRRPGRQRGGAQADREPRHQCRGDSARRGDVSGGIRAGFGSASTLTVADAHAIRREDPAVAAGRLSDPPAGPSAIWQPELDDDHPGRQRQLSADHQLADRGRPRLHRRGRQHAPPWSAIIGQTVARQLFGPTKIPLGAFIQVKSMPLRVIGVLAAKGQSPFGQDQDDLVMMPFTTAERKVLGVAAPSQAADAAQLALSAAAQPLQSAAAPDRLTPTRSTCRRSSQTQVQTAIAPGRATR